MANNINWFPGHMRKALNETGERLKLVDIVYETADCHPPKLHQKRGQQGSNLRQSG